MAVDVMMMVMMPVIVLMIMPVRMIVFMPVSMPVPVPVIVIVGAVIDMAGLVAVGLLAQPTGHIDRFGRRIIKAGVK